MSGKTAILLANGPLGEPDILTVRLRGITPDLVIAADGGARHAAALGLTLTSIVGDLDSHPAVPGVSTESYAVDKDETDLELAMKRAVASGAEEIIVLGGVGGRLDMTLANCLLLCHPDLADRHVMIWHGPETAFLLRPPGGPIAGAAGDRVSLIPLGGEVDGLITDGLAFPLHNERLVPGPARGVSNRLIQASGSVRLTTGNLLVVHAPASGGGV